VTYCDSSCIVAGMPEQHHPPNGVRTVHLRGGRALHLTSSGGLQAWLQAAGEALFLVLLGVCIRHQQQGHVLHAEQESRYEGARRCYIM
jgi:hypothetical protein